MNTDAIEDGTQSGSTVASVMPPRGAWVVPSRRAEPEYVFYDLQYDYVRFPGVLDLRAWDSGDLVKADGEPSRHNSPKRYRLGYRVNLLLTPNEAGRLMIADRLYPRPDFGIWWEMNEAREWVKYKHKLPCRKSLRDSAA